MAIYNVMYGTTRTAFAEIIVNFPYGATRISCSNNVGYTQLSTTSVKYYIGWPTSGVVQTCNIECTFSGIVKSETVTIMQNITKTVNMTSFKREFFSSTSGRIETFSKGSGNSAYSQGTVAYGDTEISMRLSGIKSVAVWPTSSVDMTGWKYLKIRSYRNSILSDSNYNLVISQSTDGSFWPSKVASATIPYQAGGIVTSIDVSGLWGNNYYIGPYIYSDESSIGSVVLNVYDLYLETQ